MITEDSIIATLGQPDSAGYWRISNETFEQNSELLYKARSEGLLEITDMSQDTADPPGGSIPIYDPDAGYSIILN
ncbi:hypothetical protein H6775_02045 [Candidatus Nomurabacteria bacterium]|nr:hypothetical protein [Candidatus Nomurabacteria bacterium]